MSKTEDLQPRTIAGDKVAPFRSVSLYRKLKPGPGRTSKEVTAHQRARLQGALIELATSDQPKPTVRMLAGSAGVSTRTFYSHYDNIDACFAATYRWVMQCAWTWAYEAALQGRGWEQQLRLGLAALFDGLTAHPKAARFALVNSFDFGAGLHPAMKNAGVSFERLLLAADLDEGAAPPSMPLITGIVGAVMRAARRGISTQGVSYSPQYVDEIADWILGLLAADLPKLSKARRFIPEPSHRLSARPSDERRRIIAATAKLLTSKSYEEITISSIRVEAGVSRRAFDTWFVDKADCFLETVESLAVSSAGRAWLRTSQDCWQDTLREMVEVLCVELADNPPLARLLGVEVLTAGSPGLLRCEYLVERGAGWVRAIAGSQAAESSSEMAVAAAWSIVVGEVTAGRERRLPLLAPHISHMLVASVSSFGRPEVSRSRVAATFHRPERDRKRASSAH